MGRPDPLPPVTALDSRCVQESAPTVLAAPVALETHTPKQQLAMQPDSPAAASPFVALSKFTVAQKTEEVKHAFQQRPHLVDDANGFLRMDVLSPADAPDEVWLITYWTDEQSFLDWHHSHLYRESHQGIPKGFKLVPKSVSIRFFEYIAS